MGSGTGCVAVPVGVAVPAGVAVADPTVAVVVAPGETAVQGPLDGSPPG